MKQSNDKKWVLPLALKGHKENSARVPNPFSFTMEELKELFKVERKPGAMAKAIMFAIGVILTPVSLTGAIVAYCFSYKRTLFKRNESPRFHNLPGLMKAFIVAGIIGSWLVLFLAIIAYFKISQAMEISSEAILMFMVSNTILSLIIWAIFIKWVRGLRNLLLVQNKYGSAEWTPSEQLDHYRNKAGVSIGASMVLPGEGHGLVLGSTGSGKSANFVIPNLLGIGAANNSSFSTDVKGELVSVVAESLKARDFEVVALNFWGLLPDRITDNRKYNPLDILTDKSNKNLIDDLAIIGEILVPIRQEDANSFFTNSARNFLIALLLYMVVESGKEVNLAELWRLVRLRPEEMDEILGTMATSDDPLYGDILAGMAQETISQQQNTDTWGSILSNACESTAFMRSPVLREHLVSDFNPYSLNGDKKIAMFFVLPADKIDTQATLTKLITVSLMRAIVRKPTNNRVTFFLDEAAATMQSISEVPRCLSLYRSYGINTWLIYQDMSQLKDAWGKKWESIWANCEVKNVLGITDQFSAEYLSRVLGDKTDLYYNYDWMGNISNVEAVKRNLQTPDEIKELTDEHALLLIGKNKRTFIRKQPYYLNPRLKSPDGSNLYDSNPYVKNNL